MTRINYEPLREWIRLRPGMTHQRMAEIGGIDKSTLSGYLTRQKALPGEVILSWQEAFGWSIAEMARYCLNGPMPVAKELIVDPDEYRALQALKQLVGALK